MPRGELAKSRHAHWQTSATTLPSTNLTVAPAPIDGIAYNGAGGHDPAPLAPSDNPAITGNANYDANNTRPGRPSAVHELGRYTKIVRRLQWKLPFLAQGYHKAVHRERADPAAVAEAELMFKLDFFEYYMLIERALVHLLGVFGVDIPRGCSPPAARHRLAAASAPATTAAGRDNPFGRGEEDGRNRHRHVNNRNNRGLAASVWRSGAGGGRHRFHANVLAALDREDSPLHHVLGTGEVREALGRAKHLRNRWKTAGEELEVNENGRSAEAGAGPGREWRARKVAAPLESYRLEEMLEHIFDGFEESFKAAEQFVRGDAEQWAELDTDMLCEDGGAAAGDEEEQWEFMVDAMDWEAV